VAILERPEQGVISISCIAELRGGERFLASDLGGLPSPFLDEKYAPRETPASLASGLNDQQLPSDAPAGMPLTFQATRITGQFAVAKDPHPYRSYMPPDNR